jgi:MYXO-CTERM domain-containing protein
VYDTDDDGDGLPTRDERPDGMNEDTDRDGVPDYLDADDDGDKIPTARERAEGKKHGGLDLDKDGKDNDRDTDSDGDGIRDRDEPDDADGDGVPDYLQASGRTSGSCSTAPGRPGSPLTAAVTVGAIGWLARRRKRRAA